MGSIAGSIPNLIGGVSQQPQDIRPVNTAKSLINTWLSPAIGLVTRPCTEYIGQYDGFVGSDGYIAQHNIQKSSGNFQVNVFNGGIYVMNTETGAVMPVTATPNALAYLNSGGNSRDLGFVTISDTTFIFNRSRTVTTVSTPETGLTGQLEEGVPRRNPNRYATVWVKQRLSGLHYYSIYINNVERAQFYTDEQAPSVIAQELIKDLASNVYVQEAYKYGVAHSIITLRLNQETDFIEAVGDADSMQGINDSVEQFADLPRSDLDGRMIRINQSDEVDDDYWVWYKKGKWEETVGWNAQERLNNNSMPVKLVDNGNGTFTLDTTEWQGRTVGDANSNPTPSFVGQTINEMFIYKGRMCILSGENFIASQVSDFESFYRSTCTQLLDDDPIDIASPESRGADLLHQKEFNDKLLLFSQFDQFSIEGDADGLLSPNTVQIDLVNSYNTAKDVTPVVASPNVIFADDFGNRNFATLLEYQVERVFGKQVALSLTDSVPEYVPSGVYKLANSSTDNIMLVATEGDRKSLYAYHYYYNNDGKIQAAWDKWIFGGNIYNIGFEGDKLLITMIYGTKIVVVGMTFHLNVDDVLTDESVLLDNRRLSDDVTVTFDGEHSTVTLPYSPSAKSVAVVAPSYTGSVLPKGRLLKPWSLNHNSLIFQNVDLTNIKFFIGDTIEMEWELNPLYIRDDKQVPIQDGRTQLRSISFLYSNSSHFTVETTAPSRETRVSSYTGITVGRYGDTLNSLSLDSGEFRVPAYGQADQVKIVVKATTPWRVRFTSVEWGGTYRPKRRRV